jgi:hypothetical protein
MTDTKKFLPPSSKKNTDDGLSKNHSKSVRFRLRVQQDKEALEQLKEYKHDQRTTNRVP